MCVLLSYLSWRGGWVLRFTQVSVVTTFLKLTDQYYRRKVVDKQANLFLRSIVFGFCPLCNGTRVGWVFFFLGCVWKGKLANLPSNLASLVSKTGPWEQQMPTITGTYAASEIIHIRRRFIYFFNEFSDCVIFFHLLVAGHPATNPSSVHYLWDPGAPWDVVVSRSKWRL